MNLSRWWTIFLAILTVEVLLLLKLLRSQDSSTELLLVIGIVAVLLVLTLRIEDLNKVSVGKDGITAEIAQVKDKLQEVEVKVKEQVNQIESDLENRNKDLKKDLNRILLSSILDGYEYKTLLKITGDEPNDQYQFNPPHEQYLLEKLRNRGLIYELGKTSIFDDRSPRMINVRKHFKITERGEEYLNILQERGLDKELIKIVAILEGQEK